MVNVHIFGNLAMEFVMIPIKFFVMEGVRLQSTFGIVMVNVKTLGNLAMEIVMILKKLYVKEAVYLKSLHRFAMVNVNILKNFAMEPVAQMTFSVTENVLVKIHIGIVMENVIFIGNLAMESVMIQIKLSVMENVFIKVTYGIAVVNANILKNLAMESVRFRKCGIAKENVLMLIHPALEESVIIQNTMYVVANAFLKINSGIVMVGVNPIMNLAMECAPL
jgi:hypothetical protein